MQNPFPGIDPYVEASGALPDFHVTFMGAWREAISAKLPGDYVARLEERVTIIEHEESRPLRRGPDITISQASPGQQQRERRAEGAGVATLDKVSIEPEPSRISIEDEVRQTYIPIIRLPDRRLVAVLELLSPTNKSGDGRSQYLAKRQQIMLSDAHLVELDLLIAGKRLPLDIPVRQAHFYSVISRAGQRPDCEVYPWDLANRMPSLPVPLADADPDIVVRLADVLAVTYQRGEYYKTIDYQSPLELPLSDNDHVWVKEQVAKAAK
jgi:hypothetical protein